MVYLYLLPAALSDLDSKSISFPILLAGFGLACWKLTESIMSKGMSSLLGMVPGLIFICLTILTKNKVGMADGISLIIVGAIDGYRVCVITAITGLVILAIFCLILLALRKVKKESRIPFLPFLLLSRIITGLAVI